MHMYKSVSKFKDMDWTWEFFDCDINDLIFSRIQNYISVFSDIQKQNLPRGYKWSTYMSL